MTRIWWGKGAVLSIAVMTWGLCRTGHASNVLAGSDFLATTSGTFFDFGGPIGRVDLEGRPIGPGNTDTVVQRQADAMLPSVGSSDTIPIELVALSLQSVAPVNIGGSFFDVFVTLTPMTHSTGMATITHEFADNGTPAPEGTFTSFFDVFFDASFNPVSGPGAFVVPGSLQLQTAKPASWSHEPEPGFIVPPGSSNFFIVGGVMEVHPGGQGMHNAMSATPEPGTMLLLGSGLAVLAGFRRKKDTIQKA